MRSVDNPRDVTAAYLEVDSNLFQRLIPLPSQGIKIGI